MATHKVRVIVDQLVRPRHVATARHRADERRRTTLCIQRQDRNLIEDGPAGLIGLGSSRSWGAVVLAREAH